MTKTAQDFEMWSGNHINVTFTVLDENSASVDLTGASAIWAISNDADSGSLVKRSTDSGCGITISGCTFTVSLSPADTANLAGTYYHEAKIRDADTDESTVAVGNVKINFNVIP